MLAYKNSMGRACVLLLLSIFATASSFTLVTDGRNAGTAFALWALKEAFVSSAKGERTFQNVDSSPWEALDQLGRLQSSEEGEDVNRTLEGGRKPLHYAADCGQLEILEFLLLKGADINAPDKHSITPLLSAVYEGHVTCVKLLLSKGADKTVRGPDGLTAFEATDNQAIKALLQ